MWDEYGAAIDPEDFKLSEEVLGALPCRPRDAKHPISSLILPYKQYHWVVQALHMPTIRCTGSRASADCNWTSCGHQSTEVCAKVDHE